MKTESDYKDQAIQAVAEKKLYPVTFNIVHKNDDNVHHDNIIGHTDDDNDYVEI